MDHTPDPVDVHVGRRIRLLRRERKMTMENLAEAIGITYQQMGKYEGAQNRVSASRLHKIAVTLQVNVGDFFIDLEPHEVEPTIPWAIRTVDANLLDAARLLPPTLVIMHTQMMRQQAGTITHAMGVGSEVATEQRAN